MKERITLYMQGTINHILIKGIKAVVPTTIKNNLDYAGILGERRCKKQVKLTGVQQRHTSRFEQKSADLALEAAEEMIKALQWESSEIDVLVFATQNPLFHIPSTAFWMQKKLGMKNESIVFDINLGCSAALVGIQIVSSLLLQGRENAKGLLVISDAVYDDISDALTPDIAADRMLFGSAGTAVALERNDGIEADIPYLIKSDGNRFDMIIQRSGEGFYMDGEGVFSFGIDDVCNDLRYFKEVFGIEEKNIDFYSMHQAQELMLNTIDSLSGIDKEKELRSLHLYGNTNGSSVLLNLCANIDKFREKDSLNLILCAFGVGLSWAYMNIFLPVNAIFPASFSDKHYEE